MIYNLVQYLLTNLSSLNFVVDGATSQSPDDLVVVSDSGGTVDNYTGRKDMSVQFISRSKNHFIARQQAITVFELINNVFGLVLPEIIVSGVTYPEVKTYRIVSIQAPGYLGTSDDFYEMYSFNVTITLNYS